MSKEMYKCFKLCGLINDANQISVPDVEGLRNRYQKLCDLLSVNNVVFTEKHISEEDWSDALSMALSLGAGVNTVSQLETAWCLIQLKTVLKSDSKESDTVAVEDNIIKVTSQESAVSSPVVSTQSGWSELDNVSVNIFTDDAWFVSGIHKLYPQWSYAEVVKDKSMQLYGTVRSNSAINIFVGKDHTWYDEVNAPGFLAGSFYGVGTYEILSQIYKTIFEKEAPIDVDINADRKSLTPQAVRELTKENPYPEDFRVEKSERVFFTARTPLWLKGVMKNEKINIFSDSKGSLGELYRDYPNWSFIFETESGNLEEFTKTAQYKDGYNIFVGRNRQPICPKLCEPGFLDGKVYYERDFRAVYEIARLIYGKEAVKEYDVCRSVKPRAFDPGASEIACKNAGVVIPAHAWVEMSRMPVTVYVTEMHIAEELYKLCPTWAYLLFAYHPGDIDWVPLFNTTPELGSYMLSVVDKELLGTFTAQVIHTDIFHDMYVIAMTLLGGEQISIIDNCNTCTPILGKNSDDSVQDRLSKVKVNIYTEDRDFVKDMYKMYPNWSYTEVQVEAEVNTPLFSTDDSDGDYSILIYRNKEVNVEPGSLNGQVRHTDTDGDLAAIAKIIFGDTTKNTDMAKTTPLSSGIESESVWAQLAKFKVNVFTENRKFVENLYELYPDWAYLEITSNGSIIPLYDTDMQLFDAVSIYLYADQEASGEIGVFDGQVHHQGTFSDLKEIAKIVLKK